MTTLFYAFDHAHETDGDELKALVGGKGAGLAAMTGLGIPVPPGFTLPTTVCLEYLGAGWNDAMSQAVTDGLATIERAVDRRIGDPAAPLLLSVRSGAAISMPGMMDTVLNAGMTEDVARGLATRSGDADFAWDTYRRAVVSFAQVVLGVPAAELAGLEAAAMSESADVETGSLAFGAAVAAAGHEIPADPSAQVAAAVEAVFRSWHSERAKAYREREGIDHSLGTAATVQAMVFGNMGDRSGTGVAFSRCPSTGDNEMMGDFLIGAQGEDVVAGTHKTMPLAELAATWPDVWAELVRVAEALEHDCADMVDLEFTVEDGKLWLLQTRVAKRSPAAVFRTAVEMANDPDFPVDRAMAVDRCGALLDDPPQLPDESAAGADDAVVLATGLAASPGRAIGVVSLDPDDALDRSNAGAQVVLVRQETSPADIHGMGASVGLVTTLGGMVSHAAVVARSWGIAAVVGCSDVELTTDAMVCGEHRIEPGTIVTVDGDSGRVLLGEHVAGTRPLPEVETIEAWARAVAAGAPEEGADAVEVDPSGAVDLDDCLRLVSMKAMANAEGLAEPLGAAEADVAGAMAALVDQGLIAELRPGLERYGPTDDGRARIAALYEPELAFQAEFATALDRFHEPNMKLKEVVTAWQMRDVDGEQVMNDHTDSAYDAAVLERLRTEVHEAVLPLLSDLVGHVPRLSRYVDRLESSLAKLAEDDHRYVAHPLLDSYHTVWFEMHEDLIKLAGTDRKTETELGRA